MHGTSRHPIFLLYLGRVFSLGRLIKAERSIVMDGSIHIGLNFALGMDGWEETRLCSEGVTRYDARCCAADLTGSCLVAVTV
jgi:hypothetical protein